MSHNVVVVGGQPAALRNENRSEAQLIASVLFGQHMQARDTGKRCGQEMRAAYAGERCGRECGREMRPIYASNEIPWTQPAEGGDLGVWGGL